jgi:hypothetical protein
MSGQRDVTHIADGVGVEFSYLTIKDEGDEIGRIGVYSTSCKDFLPHVLTKERLSNAVIVMMLSLAEPWTLDDQILYWAESLEQHVKELKIDDKEMGKLQRQVADRFATYTPPDKEGEAILMPVPEG